LGVKIKYSVRDGAYDEPGVEALNNLFSISGIEILNYPDGRYGVDVGVMLGNIRTFDVDAEVRPDWKGEKFPYDPVHVVPRKVAKKFDRPVFFATISNNGKRMMLVNKDVLVPVEPMKNRRSWKEAEEFYGYYQGENKYFFFDLEDAAQCKETMLKLILSLQ
jgi:hypothetical protein